MLTAADSERPPLRFKVVGSWMERWTSNTSRNETIAGVKEPVRPPHDRWSQYRRTDLLVSRIRHGTTRVARYYLLHSPQLFEDCFRAPEAPTLGVATSVEAESSDRSSSTGITGTIPLCSCEPGYSDACIR